MNYVNVNDVIFVEYFIFGYHMQTYKIYKIINMHFDLNEKKANCHMGKFLICNCVNE